MAKEAIGSNAIFSGPQKGLTVIGKHAYAYSGLTNAPAAPGGTALEFTTGPYLVDSKLTVGSANAYTNDVTMELMFNDQIVYAQIFTNTSQEYITGVNPYEFIIPPLTKVTLTFENTSGGGTSNWYAILKGNIE